MRVFLSHRKDPDAPFARRLREELEQCGYETFFDEVDLTVGGEVKDLLSGLRTSDVLLFIVSGGTTHSFWQGLELGGFLNTRREGNVIVIVRHGVVTPEEQVHLHCLGGGRLWLTWTDQDPWPAAFARLKVGLERARLRREAHSSRQCDRDEQWAELTQEILREGHKVLLLPGPENEDPDRFLERVRFDLNSYSRPEHPCPEVRLVELHGTSPSDLLASLVRGFRRSSVNDLAGHLDRLAAHRKVLILHQPLQDRTTLELFRRYCQEALAQLLSGVGGHGVLILQPVNWYARPYLRWLLARLTELFGGDRGPEQLLPHHHRQLIRSVLGRDLHAESLRELELVSQREVELFLARLRFEPGEVLAAATRALADASCSRTVFNQLEVELQRKKERDENQA